MAKSETSNLSGFETALEELEKLVSEMESGELSLDNALQQFEKGITLAKQGQKALEEAEQKVKILMQQQGETKLEDFDGEPSE